MNRGELAAHRAAYRVLYKAAPTHQLHAAGVNLCKLANTISLAQDDSWENPEGTDPEKTNALYAGTVASIALWCMQNLADEDLDELVEALNGRERGAAMDEPAAFPSMPKTGGSKTAQDATAFEKSWARYGAYSQ